MKTKTTIAGLLIICLMILMNHQTLLGSTNGLTAVPDTLIRDSCAKARVYGFPPFKLTNNIVGVNVIYTSSDTNIISITGNIAKIKGAGSANISAHKEGDITTVTKKVIIYPKVLDVTTPSLWRNVGAPNPKFVVTCTGFVPGEDESSALSVKPLAMCNANAGSPVGVYPIQLMGGSAKNYDFSFDKTAKLTVVGVGFEEESSKILLYPNPAKDNVTISGVSGSLKIALCTMDGVVVKNIVAENGIFSVMDLPKGAYLIKISDGKEELVKKLIVE